MNEFFVPGLYVLSGICFYAMLHHGMIAFHRPPAPNHLVFAVLCLFVALYIVAKAGAYRADTAQVLVVLRRWEMSFAAVILGLLPWFVAEYTGLRPRILPAALSGFFAILLAANLLLPYGIQFVEFPDLSYLTLPWGEQIVDLRVLRRGVWHNAAWVGVFAVFGYGFYACIAQYRRGERRRAVTLAAALGLFFLFVLVNWLVNHGVFRFTHTAEFGFLALVAVMSLGLTQELRESEQRMRAVLDNVPAVIYMKDTDGRYLWINRHYEELFSVRNELVAGKTDYDLFPPAQANAFRANDREVLETRQPLQVDEVADVVGEPHVYITLKFPVLYPDGRPYAVCGVSTDVTEARAAKAELNLLRSRVWHADRVVRAGVMTASLAHELSQPLAAILSNAQAGLRFLGRDTPDLKELTGILQDIARDDKRAAGVIRGLQAMLRQQETPKKNIDLGECVRELLTLMHTEFIEHRIDCETALEPGCMVLADRVQIQQVVLNLVLNAMEAMAGQPETRRCLRVSVAPAGGNETQLAVRDSGTGIPEDQLGSIFDGFFTTKDKGLGIGLSVCRSIAESHAGRIRVERNNDYGVTFFLTLPFAAKGATAGAKGALQNGSAVASC